MLLAYIALNYNKSASHFDLHLNEGRLRTKNVFNFFILKFQFICKKKNPVSIAYRGQCICLSVDAIFQSFCFLSEIHRKRVVENKEARVLVVKLKSLLRTFHDLFIVMKHVPQMITEIFHLSLVTIPFFTTFHRFSNIYNTVGATVGTENIYHSGTHVFISRLLRFVLFNLQFFVQRFVDYNMYFCLFILIIVLPVLVRLRARVTQ